MIGVCVLSLGISRGLVRVEFFWCLVSVGVGGGLVLFKVCLSVVGGSGLGLGAVVYIFFVILFICFY